MVPTHRRRLLPYLLMAIVATTASGCASGTSADVVGDRVWRDTNRNGVQDPAEPGAAAVVVGLYREDATLFESTTTDEMGAYGFEGVPGGRYFLQFTALQENDFVRPNAGDDDLLDSDADPVTGRTELFTVDASQSDSSWDAGLVSKATPTPAPPQATPTYTPTPVIPPTGGTFEFHAAFTEVENDCGFTAYYEDRLVVEIAEDGKTITFRQPSSGDVNTGEVSSDGSFEVSSERESYVGSLEIERDESGRIVRVALYAVNTYEDAFGCVVQYEVVGDVEVPAE